MYKEKIRKTRDEIWEIGDERWKMELPTRLFT